MSSPPSSPSAPSLTAPANRNLIIGLVITVAISAWIYARYHNLALTLLYSLVAQHLLVRFYAKSNKSGVAPWLTRKQMYTVLGINGLVAGGSFAFLHAGHQDKSSAAVMGVVINLMSLYYNLGLVTKSA
jgi:hypothetical protein